MRSSFLLPEKCARDVHFTGMSIPWILGLPRSKVGWRSYERIGVKLSPGPKRSTSGRKYSNEWSGQEWNTRHAHIEPRDEALGTKQDVGTGHEPRWEAARAGS